jgi:hypothetical protein
MVPRSGLTRLHRWLINSASAVLPSEIDYLLSFEYRTGLSGQENKREMPGKYPDYAPCYRAFNILSLVSERGRIICSVDGAFYGSHTWGAPLSFSRRSYR